MEDVKYEFYVAGVQFHELKNCISRISEGMALELDPEPTNQYDPNAVAIKVAFDEDDIFMIGYVPKKISAEVSADLEIGDLDCIVTELNPSAKPWEQIKVALMEVIDG